MNRLESRTAYGDWDEDEIRRVSEGDSLSFRHPPQNRRKEDVKFVSREA
jgi:hypothetical protein